MEANGEVAIASIILLFVTLSVSSVSGAVYNTFYIQVLPISAETPKVILQQGIAGISTIYTSNTSAKVIVEAPVQGNTTYDYVLKVANRVADGWKVSLRVYNSLNIGRLSSAKISFHDGTTSDQIIMNGGVITQSEGAPYDLAGSTTIHISISNLQATESGTSRLYVYLKVQMPNTSTYNLFVITFEIT